MKKILIIFLLALFGAAQGQTFSTLLKAKTQQFNILDYGATNGGTIEDATAIQNAINAATEYIAESEDGGGTVYIPSGIWYINKPDTLKSNITIEIDRNAQFRFPSDYTGAMWVNDSTKALVRCYVKGGRFYQTTNNFTFAKLYSSQNANYIMFVKFEDNYVERANIVFDLRTYGTGWVNANYFLNQIAWMPVEFVRFTESANNGGMDANIFANCQVQPDGGVTTYAINNLTGSYNLFSNFVMWDSDDFSQGVLIDEEGAYNTIIGSLIPKNKFVNEAPGNYNFVMSNGQILSGTEIFNGDNDTTLLGDDILNMEGGKIYAPDQIIIHGEGAVKDTINKLVVSHNSDAGSSGTPAGDIAIQLKSYAEYPDDYKSANGSVRIMSRNQASSNYGSWMYLQTHGTGDSQSYVDAQTLGPYGDVSYAVINTGGLGTSISADNLARFVYYNGGAAVDLSDNPQIVAGRNGQIITIIGSSDTNTLTLDDGTGLILSGRFVMGAGDTITLVYSTGLSAWVETSRSDN